MTAARTFIWALLALGFVDAWVSEKTELKKACSCELCSLVWQPETQYLSQSGSVKEGSKPASLQCAAISPAALRRSQPEACVRYCSEECAPVSGAFARKASKVHAAVTGATLVKQAAVLEMSSQPMCQLSPKQEAAVEAQNRAFVFLQMQRTRTERAVEKAGCPPPQKCSCWCDCPEILLGRPMPPGLPPVTAVNPYAPPPPAPMPPPPPFFAGPPPLGIPFNPLAPAALLLQQGKQGFEVADTKAQEKQPCQGPECRPPSGCPPAMPCNCYCACRPPVPTKDQAINGR